MNSMVIYGSRHGNTQTIAYRIAAGLRPVRPPEPRVEGRHELSPPGRRVRACLRTAPPRLRHVGVEEVFAPESFFVAGQPPELLPGKLDRAEAWADALGRIAQAERGHRCRSEHLKAMAQKTLCASEMRTNHTTSSLEAIDLRSRVSDIVCILAMTVICLYSGVAIHRIIVSNAPPTITFTLGTAHRNVTYCDSQSLDVYTPSNALTRPLPLAVFVHGGGLTAGDKSYLNPVFLNALASAGYAVASLNYRLAPQYKPPTQIREVKCAIRYLRANAQTYGINAAEIFAFGTSYGGELVTLAALTGHQSVFDAGPYLNESSAIAAAGDMFGPANLPGWISPSSFQRVFGGDETSLALASPAHFISTGAEPILIIQGMEDTTVPESQSVQLYDKLTASGDPTELILVHNMGHMFVQVGSRPIEPSLPQLAQGIVSFFDQYRERA